MNTLSFHIKFKLNNKSFTSINELLAYARHQVPSVYPFLFNWFSSDEILMQTSGSTGKPKNIMLPKEFMLNSALATGAYFNLNQNTTALLCLSPNYIAGKMMLVRAMVLGWQLDVVASTSDIRIKKEYNFSAMVPLQVEYSLKKIHKIEKLIVGGGVVSNKLKAKLKNIKTKVFATYGMTETITHIAVKKLNNSIIKPNFYEVLPNVNIYIDQRNCLVIDAPNVSENLLVTNDVVQLVSENQFEWLGRYDNVINSGGIKLHPEKIEEKLSEIIQQRFFVAGIFDEVLGEKLILIIEGIISNKMKQSLELKISKLQSLSKYQTPKELFFLNEFVETATKKIQRKKTLDLIDF